MRLCLVCVCQGEKCTHAKATMAGRRAGDADGAADGLADGVTLTLAERLSDGDGNGAAPASMGALGDAE